MENKNTIPETFYEDALKHISGELDKMEKVGFLKMPYDSLFLDLLEIICYERYAYHNLKITICDGDMVIIILKCVNNEEYHRKRETVGTAVKRWYREIRGMDAEAGYLLYKRTT